jgi:uncharacterized protein YdeI (YjbR/CyaY-like superfamily)
MGVMDDAERFEPARLEEWTAWLATHHADTPGVWLVTHTQSSGRAEFDYEHAVREALCWGWVDSTQRSLEGQRTMIWYAARRPGSVWTRNNKQRVALLEEAGRMQPPGAAAVEAARASGMWTLMDDVEDLVVPDDLAAALDALPGARAHWDAFPPSARKQALAWIVVAKRAETRAGRVADVAGKSARGERPRG